MTQLAKVTRGIQAIRSMELFDLRPLEIDGFTLRAKAAEPNGSPDLNKTIAALKFAESCMDSSPYWWGDILRYAKGSKWSDKFSQALDATGFATQTMYNVVSVCNRVAEPERILAPTVWHAEAVAPLPREEQTEWLDKARTEGWNVRDLKLHIKASQRRMVIEGQAELVGKYRVCYSDNPWLYDDRPPSGKGQREHFPGMTIDEQCKLPILAHMHRDAVLLMWTTAPLILQNPGPREVGEAWGFTYKQQIIWDKIDGNYSHYTGGNHEILTIWTRGSCVPDVPTGLPDSVQVIQKSRVHSEKPEEFRRLIEKHWTHGPYLELFGREKKKGWTVFGNDARLWASQEAKSA